ncbi:unnamed protein product [Moneuplotes crassus]|uniref:Uncharacterized protein n=1 Tax=Euplotes crassus TaxID=5936 RepID=A0AAD1Y0J3_EUPCR|nr:unnamed protein product [Moneuplotes crassus]
MFINYCLYPTVQLLHFCADSRGFITLVISLSKYTVIRSLIKKCLNSVEKQDVRESQNR